jgi:ATP-dependent DNA helicase RecG
VALLLSGLARAERKKIDADLASGKAHLAVGTHAVISGSTRFSNLGLAVVDEQHRFGVSQRLALRKKGGMPDILVASATPIPRTLALTLYGDLRLSIINELPPGRRPVKTFRVTEKKRGDMVGFVRKKIGTGGRAFFVLPLVEESEKLDEVKSVIQMAAELQNRAFRDHRVEMLHGRMAPAEKEAVMRRFREGACRVLAATTVVEVGVDVPDADVMVIEHPERFGLAQLHQLRGRIGRGGRESFCFLVIGPACSQEAYDRLGKLAETHDGFKIAELDFAIRGAGQLSGLAQSGMPEFRFLHLLYDRDLIEAARDDARDMVEGVLPVNPDEAARIEEALKAYGGIREELLGTG